MCAEPRDGSAMKDPNAVINLNSVFRWGSAGWWQQSTQGTGMRDDPCEKYEMETQVVYWVGKEDWMTERTKKCALADETNSSPMHLTVLNCRPSTGKKKEKAKSSERHLGTWDPRTQPYTQVKRG